MLSKYFKNKRKSPRLHRVLNKEDADNYSQRIPEIATDERVREVDHFDRNALHVAVRHVKTAERINVYGLQQLVLTLIDFSFFLLPLLRQIYSFVIDAITVCQPSHDTRYYGYSTRNVSRWFVGTRQKWTHSLPRSRCPSNKSEVSAVFDRSFSRMHARKNQIRGTLNHHCMI